MKFLILTSFVFYSCFAFSAEDCDPTTLNVNTPERELLQTLQGVSEAFYADVSKLKVNMDGEGKLSVSFEDGMPKILKFTYKNGKGEVVMPITFEDLAAGKELAYENKDVPGNAITVKRGEVFEAGKPYEFVISHRTSIKPDKYETNVIVFDPTKSKNMVSHDGKNFKQVTLSPGVSLFSWDGTFKKIEFK